MAEAKRMTMSARINILPPEMVEKIFKLLSIKMICKARTICKQWKEIIDKGNLLKKASGKGFCATNLYIKSITNIVISF